MQILNQIGHIQYWGISPAINFLSHRKQDQPFESPIRVLITGCSDIRHILKTISEVSLHPSPPSIQIYFHQTQKQLLCRAFLFLHIIHQQNLNFDERVELFLDLYGNTLIKEKDAQYLHRVVPDLLNFIHDEKKTVTVLKQMVDLKHVKFEERDQMSEIISAWKMNVPFEIEKYRDQRLRYHYKQRYDFRTNLIDWDYNMMILEYAPIIHYHHYREWRQTGIAFENRFSVYSNPNRTLSSYIPGKKNSTKESCLVRGYWGDIVCSPYFTFGIESDSEQKDKLFQKANLKYIGHSMEVSEYNLRDYIQGIQTLKRYKRVFEDYYRSEERKRQLEKQKQDEERKKNGAIKEEQEEDEEEQKDRKPRKEKKQLSIKQKQQQEEPTEQVQEKKEEPKEQPKPKNQEEYDELLKKTREEKDSKQVEYQNVSQPRLKRFQLTNLKFFPLCMDMENLKKKKFQNWFDVGVVGFSHTAYFNKDLQSVFKKGAMVYCETAHLLASHTKEERVKMNLKLEEVITGGGLVKVEDGMKHHVLYKKVE